MRCLARVALLVMMTADLAVAGPASGTVTSQTGTIAPTHAIAYTVRDSRSPRNIRVELLLTDVPVDAAMLRDTLDPHATSINVDQLRDRNYVLLWVGGEAGLSMNATYSRTMTQYLNDAAGGLKAELTTNTGAKIEGRVYSAMPLKTMDGPTYSIDVTFSADIVPALTGPPLPAGGGEPGRAFTAFLGAVAKKNWAGIKAGLSPKELPLFEKDYNTPAENLSVAVDVFNARLPMAKARVAGGQLVNPTVAVLEMEGERFGGRVLTLVRMVKTGTAWQFEGAVTAGSLR